MGKQAFYLIMAICAMGFGFSLIRVFGDSCVHRCLNFPP